VVARRAEHRGQAAAAGRAGRRYHFVDQCGTTTGMARTHGRAAPGTRVEGAVPHAHWTVTTVVGALGPGGFTAAATVDGAIDGPAMAAWVEGNLGPALAPGDVVVMDNLGAHKVAGVRRAIEARGAELWFLPAYSPDLNPIEKAWAKVKGLLRDAGARTTEALGAAITRAIAAVTADDARGYFRSCGYAARGV
jgi:transposase